jgi:hypothetical protein
MQVLPFCLKADGFSKIRCKTSLRLSQNIFFKWRALVISLRISLAFKTGSFLTILLCYWQICSSSQNEYQNTYELFTQSEERKRGSFYFKITNIIRPKQTFRTEFLSKNLR